MSMETILNLRFIQYSFLFKDYPYLAIIFIKHYLPKIASRKHA